MRIQTLPGETVTRSDHAFLRLATPADLHDAVFLALSGVNVSFEPVTGFLTGFGKPMRIVGEDDTNSILLRVGHTPKSIAALILRLVTEKIVNQHTKTYRYRLRLGMDNPRLEAAIRGIFQCLTHRAARPFTRTDIADLMGWVATMAPGRIDAQIPYGCEAWGEFLRREPSLGLGWNPPPPVENFTRTIVCHVKPSPEDLVRILSHGGVGIINATAMRRKAPWAHGMSTDKRLFLASHALAPVLTWTPAYAGAEKPMLTRAELLAAATPDEAARRLYGPVWDRARALSGLAYAATREPVAEPLQAVWTHQRDGLGLFGLGVAAMPPCDPEDLRRHALSGGFNAADAARMPRPQAVTCTMVDGTDPIQTLTAQAELGAKLCTHHAAARVEFTEHEKAEVVDHLGAHWGEFVGAEFAQHRP